MELENSETLDLEKKLGFATSLQIKIMKTLIAFCSFKLIIQVQVFYCALLFKMSYNFNYIASKK